MNEDTTDMSQTETWKKDPQGEAKKLNDYWLKEYGKEGKLTFYKAKGCDVCGGSGYKGRAGLPPLLLASASFPPLLPSLSLFPSLFFPSFSSFLSPLPLSFLSPFLLFLPSMPQFLTFFLHSHFLLTLYYPHCR